MRPEPIIVPLSAGKVALISPEDAERVLQYKWSYHTGAKRKAYACRNTRVVLPDGTVKQHKILLHRFIVNAPADAEVDHENGDGLDCQRHNLRQATRSQNVANTGSRRGSFCPYKGVTFRSERNTYRAEITINGVKYRLGTYRTPDDAARAYDAAALAAWGEFAYLNFPEHRNLYQQSMTIERHLRSIAVITSPIFTN